MPAANADSLKIPHDMASSATATEFDDERFILHLERNLFLEQIEAIMDCGLFQEWREYKSSYFLLEQRWRCHQ